MVVHLKFTEFVKDYLYYNLGIWLRSFLFASIMLLLDHRYTLDGHIKWSYNITVFVSSFITAAVAQILGSWFEYRRKERKAEKNKEK